MTRGMVVDEFEGRIVGDNKKRYKIGEKIGQGGFGAVFRAVQPNLNRAVAIKIILPELANNPEVIKRFEAEAQIVAQLEHPHIVPLYDYWRDDNHIYLVMRYLNGGSLRGVLNNGPLQLQHTAKILSETALALAKAHNAGIVHRDIKPDNILLDDEGNAYLTDFGIAKSPHYETVASERDTPVGTLRYMAPEQLTAAARVGPQADIYALGIVLYEMLTGKHPFAGDSEVSLINAILSEPLPDIRDTLPELSGDIDDVIQRATNKEPMQRFPDAIEMADAFQAASTGTVFSGQSGAVEHHTIPSFGDGTPYYFVSYSHMDIEIVHYLTADLRQQNIRLWFDQVDLTPGTQDWQQAIRSAIRKSHAVLYLGSPKAQQSVYVRDELALARVCGVKIYPIWIKGKDWIDSVPLGMGSMQYIDVRDDKYQAGVKKLVEILKNLSSGQPAGLQTDEVDISEEQDITEARVEPVNPYRGLKAFRAEDERYFFGRSEFITELSATLGEGVEPPRFLCVIGASGSGKSSVIMAGLLPALRDGLIPGSEKWTYLDPFVPGDDPTRNLATVLSKKLERMDFDAIRENLDNPSTKGLHHLAKQILEKPEHRLVVYVDQFEELFTLTQPETERQKFVDVLTTALNRPDGQVLVICSLRSDFYGELAQFPRLSRLVQNRGKNILPLGLADTFDVVERPAQLEDVRLIFEEGLVAKIVDEVHKQKGALPLLQFTLDLLFQKRNGRTLTLKAYDDIGGVRGAIGKHAETTYENLYSPQHKALARNLFLQLVEVGESEGNFTRRRVYYKDLGQSDNKKQQIMGETVDAFVKARLLVSGFQDGERTIEVAHEALIEHWPTLKNWVQQRREFLKFRKQVQSDFEEWQESKHLNALLSVRRLETYKRLNEEEKSDFDQTLADFIRRSRAYRTRGYHYLIVVGGIVGGLLSGIITALKMSASLSDPLNYVITSAIIGLSISFLFVFGMFVARKISPSSVRAETIGAALGPIAPILFFFPQIIRPELSSISPIISPLISALYGLLLYLSIISVEGLSIINWILRRGILSTQFNRLLIRTLIGVIAIIIMQLTLGGDFVGLRFDFLFIGIGIVISGSIAEEKFR